MNRTEIPGSIIGYRKNGQPIRLIAGGSVDAVEPVTTQPSPFPSGPFFTADDIEKARSQEKEKLNRKITDQGTKLNAMEAEFQALRAEREAATAAEAARQAAEAEAARKAAEDEMSLRELLAKRDEEFKQQLAQINEDRARERALLEKDRQFATLQAHIQRRISEEREKIAPELVDLVTGNTPDEVEASISVMIAKTDAIASKIGEANAALAANMRGVSTTGYAADGPLDNQLANKTYSSEELGSMPMSVYAQNRQKLMGAANQSNKGLFG